jgi:hypothetical protein
MDHRNVEEIKHCITYYFRSNNLLSHRLPQAYILYKSLQNIGKSPTLFMGYLVNHDLMLYYIHYWVELDEEVHDIIGESYNVQLTKEVELRLDLSIQILDTYLNMDSVATEQKRTASYNASMQGMFFESLSAIVSPDIYDKIMVIYNKLIN